MTPTIKGKIICKVTHGSRLYKMHGEDSDYDKKGCYLPNLPELQLMRAAKNIQWKDEAANEETEIFALTEFLRHAARGEGYAIDMLHCSDSDVISNSNLWDYLRFNKSKFYTKSMKGLLGFAKTQSCKFALKSERLNAVKKVLEIFKKAESSGVARLWQIWDELPQGETHIVFGEEERNNSVDKRYVEVASKRFPATISPSYSVPILENLINSYGDRTKKASELDEKDTKSLSHAFRLASQLREIYLNKGFSYPLPDNEFLMAVKYRKLDYKLSKLDDILHESITEVEKLADNSSYPDKVDQKWLDNLVLTQYEAH